MNLRLTVAAAGIGKTDETLRIARKVATSDGDLGESDPRPWAQALSVALLAKMLNQAQKKNNKSMMAALERQLKRTGMFAAKKQMRVLLWEDFEFPPSAQLMAADEPVAPANDVMASLIGVQLFDFGDFGQPSWKVNLEPATSSTMLQRDVEVQRIQIDFDGAHFKVKLGGETVTTGQSHLK